MNRKEEGMERKQWEKLSQEFQKAIGSGDKSNSLEIYVKYKENMIKGSRDEAELGCMEASLEEKGWLK